jgi:adenylate cyclase
VATHAAVLATVYGNPDPDGIYRRLRPFSLFDGHVVPSLGLGALLGSTPVQSLSLTPQELSLTPALRPMPLDPSGCAILNFRGPSQTHKTVNIAAVIESELALVEGKKPLLDPLLFKDKYVFLGFTAPGLFDLRSSPIANVYPGVEIHATFLDNLLSGDFISQAPGWLTILMTILLACLGAVGVRLGRHAWQTILIMVLFIPIPALLGFMAYAHGIWLAVIVQYIAIAPALVATLALNYLIEGKQKRFIKGAFKQYLSPLVIEELVQHPERLKLGGELRELSIFFSDVRGFTSISERLNPEELTALLNNYLTAMTDIIYRHGGTVDKYEGDAIIAFWNAPLTQSNHAQLAVHTALECQAKLAELNPSYKSQIGSELYQRIGLNSGPVVVGNMGSRQRFNYTFLGDAGNLAARLEGINKQFGTSLLISHNTRTQLDESIAVREIARVQVVGRKEPVRVFEPMLPTFAADHQKILDIFAHGLAKYHEGSLTDALELFASIESQDAPAEAYVRRCRSLLAHPPADWTGVWVMTEK